MTDTPQTSITIDGTEYPLEDLSDDARAQVTSLQFVENELARLNAQLAVVTTAKGAYQKALLEVLAE
jgi:hypothetical protein